MVKRPSDISTMMGIQRRGIGRRSCLTSDGHVLFVPSLLASRPWRPGLESSQSENFFMILLTCVKKSAER